VVQEGDRRVRVKGGHEADLTAGGPMKPPKFDKKTLDRDDLDPRDGIFYRPFGWGFYSPWWVEEGRFSTTVNTTGTSIATPETDGLGLATIRHYGEPFLAGTRFARFTRLRRVRRWCVL
jgi:hypothetical protein